MVASRSRIRTAVDWYTHCRSMFRGRWGRCSRLLEKAGIQRNALGCPHTARFNDLNPESKVPKDDLYD